MHWMLMSQLTLLVLEKWTNLYNDELLYIKALYFKFNSLILFWIYLEAPVNLEICN